MEEARRGVAKPGPTAKTTAKGGTPPYAGQKGRQHMDAAGPQGPEARARPHHGFTALSSLSPFPVWCHIAWTQPQHVWFLVILYHN